jgi:hypothetical protein
MSMVLKLPGPIGALFATSGDWKALILVLINLLIAIVLYYPFFKKYEREMLAQEQSLNGAIISNISASFLFSITSHPSYSFSAESSLRLCS